MANFSPLPSPKRRLGVVNKLDAIRSADLSRLRAEHDKRVALGFSATTEDGKRQSSRLKISALEPVKDRHLKVREKVGSCKKRPDHTRPTSGAGRKGGLRKFIPWCS